MSDFSVPQVALKFKVHRNTVLYWIKAGYIQATVRNPFVSRPQYRISESELKKIEKISHDAQKHSA